MAAAAVSSSGFGNQNASASIFSFSNSRGLFPESSQPSGSHQIRSASNNNSRPETELFPSHPSWSGSSKRSDGAPPTTQSCPVDFSRQSTCDYGMLGFGDFEASSSSQGDAGNHTAPPLQQSTPSAFQKIHSVFRSAISRYVDNHNWSMPGGSSGASASSSNADPTDNSYTVSVNSEPIIVVDDDIERNNLAASASQNTFSASTGNLAASNQDGNVNVGASTSRHITAAPQPAGNKSGSSNPNDISCPICLDSLAELKAGNSQLVSTTCGHLFCEPCLQDSVKRTKQCPTCRKKLTKRQFHRVYL